MRSASASPFSVVSTNISSYSLTSSGTNIILNGATHHSQQITNNNNETDEQRRFRSNRSRRGLYDGKDIRTGNNLSFSMKHTKRTFKPNVFIKRVYSEILDEMVRFHLTTSTLRSIDKCGGLDNYLLTSRHITSGEGLKTKKKIVNTLKYRERKARPQPTDNSAGTTTMATEEA
jgi:large subunit ribosomal protein L28